MKTLEVHVSNPIDFTSVDDAINRILDARDYTYLMIDIGDHNFASLESLKYFKDRLSGLNMDSLCFSKVAFVHPAEFPHAGSGSEVYDFFTSKSAAREWFRS